MLFENYPSSQIKLECLRLAVEGGSSIQNVTHYAQEFYSFCVPKLTGVPVPPNLTLADEQG